MKKKFSVSLSLLLVFCMLLSVTSSVVLAEEVPSSSQIAEESMDPPEEDNKDEAIQPMDEVLVETSFADAPLFTTEEIVTLAQGEFPYIESEIGFSPTAISPQEQWVPLYDMSNNVFAYWVPVTDENGAEIGYLTVGALRDGFSNYEWSKDLSYLNEIRTCLEDPGTTMVFLPPMNYILKQTPETRSGRPEYFIANFFSSTEDVSDKLRKSTEDIQHAYDMVRNEEARQRNEILLNPMTPTPRTNWDRRLECEWEGDYNFVNIYDPDNRITTYGGNQNWFSTDYNKNRGCGPTAAANTLYYMSSRHSAYSSLWPHGNLSKQNFKWFMETMWSYTKPAIFGEASLTDYGSDVERYCRSVGVDMWTFPMAAYRHNKDACIELILDGLGWNSPVSMLNLSKGIPDDGLTWDKFYNWHWMTITKYYSSGVKAWVAVSTWGERRSIDFNVLYKYMSESLFPSGFVYFRLGD